MASVIGLRKPEWDVNKGRYAEIDLLPLMSGPTPVLLILAAYLIFVLKIGPAMMKNISAFKLKGTLILYNGLQVVLSVYLVIRYGKYILKIGVFPTKCQLVDDTERREIIISIWLYFAAKVTELMDTVFFVLRKKFNQITFLHLYHHSIMMIGTWAFLKYAPSDNVAVIGCINSLVHVVMYSYYGLAAFGPQLAKYLTWKKYVTSMQLVQFVTLIVHYIMSLKYSECPPSKGVAIFFTLNIAFFLLLFSNFYVQSYKKTSKCNGALNGMKRDCNGALNGNCIKSK